MKKGTMRMGEGGGGGAASAKREAHDAQMFNMLQT